MTLVPWWCLFLHVMGFNGHIYRHGKSWNGYNFHTYPHPAKKPVVPRDVMVDVINNVGLKLLAIHNEYNENNIAISPYGALSVIIALGEGLEGDSVNEIQQATHIPNDISVIRVGLRDIHRHLKSYFIPKEGFLSGLTLNHENVTLRPEYEDILRFYGYDTSTFNNALYPPPETSGVPEATTEGITTTESAVTTEVGRSNAMEMTTEAITESTVSSETTTLALPTEKTTTLPDVATIRAAEPTETTTVANIEESTTVITEEATSSVQQSTTITLPRTTEAMMPEVTTVQSTTTTVEPTTERITATTTEEITTPSPTITSLPTTQESTSERQMIQSVTITEETSTTEMAATPEVTFSELPTSTSTVLPSVETGTSDLPTTLVTTQISTLLPSETTVGSTAADLSSTTESVINIDTTTNLPTILITSTQSSTLLPSEMTVGSTTVDLPTATSESVINTDTTTTAVTESATSSIAADITSPFTADITSVNTTPIDVTTEKDSNDNEIDSTDSSAGFGGISKRKVRSDVTRINQTNVVQLNIRDHSFDLKRNSRSVVDYILARYYDDQFNFHNNPEPYIPEEQPSFLVYGKYKEYNINFMKYNIILPFHYEPHLNALALSFPLDSTKYYLLLLLPVDETGIDKLICDLRLNGSLKYIIANLKYRHVVATIPSFMLKGYVTLTPSFQKLGIRKVFEPRQADFSPMTTQRGIYVTNIEQAITVNIRNYVDPSAIPDHRNLHRYDPVHFKADHPFLYFVIDSDIHVTLMAGKIVNPLNSRIG